jgi:[acyl-carrier-protein] S-malonyltransferase
MERHITGDHRMTALILLRNVAFNDLENFLMERKLIGNPQISADIANINSSSQVVLSGTKSGIDFVVSLLQAEKIAAKAIDLPVGGPFHSRLMKNASEQLTNVLAERECRFPKVTIISNVTAKQFESLNDIKPLLVKQLYSPVRWYPSVLEAKRLSTKLNTFVELGPRPVLGNLLKKDFKEDTIQ